MSKNNIPERLPSNGAKYAASGFSLVITDSIVLPREPSLNAWFPFSTGRVNLSIILMIASKPSSLTVQNHDQWGSWLHQHTENRQFSSLLRPRRERPCSHSTKECDEFAAFHRPMPPVLPTERIAHLGTADCCIHPPGHEMIAITPPIIFSEEVAQNRPCH